MMIPVNIFTDDESSARGSRILIAAKDASGRAWVKHLGLPESGANPETGGVATMTEVVRVLLDRDGRKYKQWKDQYFTLKILELDFLPAEAPEFTHSVPPS